MANKRPTELGISTTPIVPAPVSPKTPVNPTYLTIKELSCYASPIVPDVNLLTNDATVVKPIITRTKAKNLPPIPLKLDSGNKSARKPPKVAVRRLKKDESKISENIDASTRLPVEKKSQVIDETKPKSPVNVVVSKKQAEKPIVTSKASVAQKRLRDGIYSLMPIKQRRVCSPVDREKLITKETLTTDCKVVMHDVTSIKTEGTRYLSSYDRRRALSPLNHGISAKTGSFLGCGRSVSDLNSSKTLDVTERKPSYSLQKGHTDFSIASLTATPATQTKPRESELSSQSPHLSNFVSKTSSNHHMCYNDSAKYLLKNSQSSQSSNCGKDLSRNFITNMNSNLGKNRSCCNELDCSLNKNLELNIDKLTKPDLDKSSNIFEMKVPDDKQNSNNHQLMSHNESCLDLRKYKTGAILDMRICKHSTPKNSTQNTKKTHAFNSTSDPGMKMPPKHLLNKQQQLNQKTRTSPHRSYRASPKNTQKQNADSSQNVDYNFPTVGSMKAKLYPNANSLAEVAPTFSSDRTSRIAASVAGQKRMLDPSPLSSQATFDDDEDSMYPRSSNYKKYNQPVYKRELNHRDSDRGLKLAASTLAQYNHPAKVRNDCLANRTYGHTQSHHKPAVQATVRPITQQAGTSSSGQAAVNDRKQLLMNMMVANNPYLWNTPKTPQQIAAHATLEQRRKHELESRIANLELWRQRMQQVNRQQMIAFDPTLFNPIIAADPNLQHMLGASNLQNAVGDNSMQASAALHLSFHAHRKMQEEEMQKYNKLIRQQQQAQIQQAQMQQAQVLHPDHIASLVHAHSLLQQQQQLQAKQAEELSLHQMTIRQMMQQPSASGQAVVRPNLINLNSLQASMYPHHP